MSIDLPPGATKRYIQVNESIAPSEIVQDLMCAVNTEHISSPIDIRYTFNGKRIETYISHVVNNPFPQENVEHTCYYIPNLITTNNFPKAKSDFTPIYSDVECDFLRHDYKRKGAYEYTSTIKTRTQNISMPPPPPVLSEVKNTSRIVKKVSDFRESDLDEKKIRDQDDDDDDY
jgi:hypothetical protein